MSERKRLRRSSRTHFSRRFPHKIVGIKQRVRGAKFQEHYNQAQMFYNSMAPHEKAHMVAAFSFELAHCDDPVVYELYTKLLNNVDFELAKQVAINVGGVLPEQPARANPGHKTRVSQTAFVPEKPTVAGRRIAILVGDGFNLAEVEGLKALILSYSANPYVIGPRRGKVYAAGERVGGAGAHVVTQHHFEDQRSTLFDAIVVPSGAHAQKLAEIGRAVHWVREAFGHCKAIGAIGEGVLFLRDAAQLPGVQYAQDLSSSAVTTSYGVVSVGKYDAASAAKDAVKPPSPSETGFIANFIYEVSKHRCYERELDGLTNKVAY
jgi:catalase